MTRPALGPLFCTRGRHLAPRREFAWRAEGRRHSWCVTCKRAYDRAKVAEKRRLARLALDPSAAPPRAHHRRTGATSGAIDYDPRHDA